MAKNNSQTKNNNTLKKILLNIIPSKGDKLKDILLKLLFIIALIGFIVSVILLFNYYDVEPKSIKEKVKKLHFLQILDFQ